MSDLPLKMSDMDEQFHTCPNADISACEYCKLLNNLAILNRTFTLRNETESVKIIEECLESVKGVRRSVDKLKPQLSRFDFSDEVQGNGYRTFIILTKISVTKCLHLIDEINHIGRVYSSTTFPVLYEKLIDWTRILRLLNVVLQCLNEFAHSAKTNSLFTSNRQALDKLLAQSKERVNVIGFHGRLLGFQFVKSVRAPLRVVGSFMAAFSRVYNTDSIFKHTIISPPDFVYYWRNPSERAERIAKVCDEDPLNFFKNFWRTQENGLLKILSNCLGNYVETNMEISIPPTKLSISTTSERGIINILPPTEYIGTKPIMVRLVSHKMRSGAVGSGNNGLNPQNGCIMEGMSKTLVIHCHGGGFVSQSSNSHLVYLKPWARGIGAPILSIDYSLAPEAPYPRGLHEAFYSYVWALKNAHLLGSTAEKIIVVGDSAGGLLLTGVIILCIELGIRVPDGALLVYTPQLLEPAITPARLLSLADPLIPYPALAACLGAYLGKHFDVELAKLPGNFVEGGWEPDEVNIENCTWKFETLELEELNGICYPCDDYHLSPLIAPDGILKRFPPTAITTSNFDPCMDDCVEFAKRLRGNGVHVTLDIKSSIPHGYLNFGKLSEECYQGVDTCLRRLQELIDK